MIYMCVCLDIHLYVQYILTYVLYIRENMCDYVTFYFCRLCTKIIVSLSQCVSISSPGLELLNPATSPAVPSSLIHTWPMRNYSTITEFGSWELNGRAYAVKMTNSTKYTISTLHAYVLPTWRMNAFPTVPCLNYPASDMSELASMPIGIRTVWRMWSS